MLRRTSLLAAALAAAIIATVVPSLRDLIAVVAVGLFMVVGNVQIGARQRVQVRQDLILAARVSRETTRYL